MLTQAQPSNRARTGRVIVLDDEAEIRGMLQRFLAGQGFEVRAVRDAAQLDACLERQPYDVLVLDVTMPGEDGLSICRRLRARGNTVPILMMNAPADPLDRVIGLEMGADDYLDKPFVPSELAARIRAMLRRQQFILRTQTLRGEFLPIAQAPVLRFGPFSLDLQREELSKGDMRMPLSFAELRLLCALAATPNRPVSRANLIERARGCGYEANDRSVDVQVLRLRRAMESDACAPRYLRTVWGIGYMLVAETEP
ncbi:response regulator [Paraburkholderia sp. NMBU_R16]|uniref:response regulator n=1 Tax=Paraburkholderia sp. NMBU_R16 TaxID=2698676 RepID=UPI001563EE1F|nr:response regulator [Paraburkholderia sp. NMBU_R16]NRO99447.1 response regulator [Paraburkholderia sp. NMBU_R16]